MNQKVKNIPAFKTEDDEREFWSTHDSTDYVDPKKLIRVPALENLKDAGNPILLVLPQNISKEIKKLARESHVSTEQMIEQILALSLRNRQRAQPSK